MPWSPSTKRTIDDVEYDRKDVGDVVHDMKRHRVEGDYDRRLDKTMNGKEARRHSENDFLAANDYAEMSESNLEEWSLQKLDELLEHYDEGIEPTAEVELNAQAEEILQQGLRSVAGFTYGQGKTGNEAVAAEQVTAQASECPTIQHGRRNPPKPVFPAADGPIPDDVSLPELCEKWPNHLTGVHLRRFIQQGWNAGKIFVSMHSDARDALTKEASLSKKMGWEIIEQRLASEKRKIAEEEQLAKPGKINLPKSSAPPPSHPPKPASMRIEQNLWSMSRTMRRRISSSNGNSPCPARLR